MQNIEKLEIYKSLFRGRDDVFARRWEKNGAYFPDYTFDWSEFNSHRSKGGTIKNFEDKTSTSLSDAELLKHLSGHTTLGIYPVVDGEMSYFLAADFDGKGWFEDCVNYRREIEKLGLKAYIERSRSGNGGHVWIFFREKYPCHRSRTIGLSAIKRALKVSDFDKDSSFDRLFPNQDFVPEDGFGNLIALPFQGKAAKEGNSMFINPTTSHSYEDQLKMLKGIVQHSKEDLDNAYNKLTSNVEGENHNESKTARLSITVDQNISLKKNQLNPELVEFLKEELNFLNTEYLTKKRLGASLYKTQKYFRLVSESDTKVFLPRGFMTSLEKFLSDKKIKYSVRYKSTGTPDAAFNSQIKLNDKQEEMLEGMLRKNQGVLVAPPGSGKTIMGLEMIARLKKPALILVHRKQLLDQWADRIQTHLNIPKSQIGTYGSGKKKLGNTITVAMLQSLARSKDLSQLTNTFGTIIIDECHHIPAKTFRNAISELNSKFLYGLTATPKRKHNDEKLIYVYIGDILADMNSLMSPGSSLNTSGLKVSFKKTGLEVPFNWKTDHFETIAKIISYDTGRNKLISENITGQIALNRKVLVLSERKEHITTLELFLKGKCESITITGNDSKSKRELKLKQVNQGHYQVLFATGQVMGEGIHIENIETLVIAFPFSFSGKLIQYVGRLQHALDPKLIIDYHDENIPFLDRQFKQRKRTYKKLEITQ